MLDGIEPGSYFNAFHGDGTRHANKAGTKKSRARRTRTGKSSAAAHEPAVNAEASDAVQGTEFSSFAAAQAAADLEHAQQMLDRIHLFGDTLRREPNLSNLQTYRKLVQEFLNEVVAGAYSLERQESGAGVLKRKRFTLVSLVNRKLDRLAAGLVQTQGEQLGILAKIDEIQGLLVDLIE